MLPGLFGFPVLPVLPPTAAKWRERLRGHLALRQEGSPPNTSHLRTCPSCLQSERIQQVNKVEKLILGVKWRRRRHLALLGLVLLAELLNLATVNAQTPWRQHVLGHLLSQARSQ